MNTILKGASQNTAESGTSIYVNAPTGANAPSQGDLVIVVVAINNNDIPTDNNGSTPFNLDFGPVFGSGYQSLSIFSRRVQYGDPNTYYFTSNGSDRWSATATVWANPHPTITYDVPPSSANTQNLPLLYLTPTFTMCNAVLINTQTVNAIDIFICCVDSDTPYFEGFGTDGSWGNSNVQAYITIAGGNQSCVILNTKNLPTIGPTPTPNGNITFEFNNVNTTALVTTFSLRDFSTYTPSTNYNNWIYVET